jgi:hypothetical protein
LFDFFWVQTVADRVRRRLLRGLEQPAVTARTMVDAVRTGQRQKQLLRKRLFEGDAFSLLTAHANG